MVFTPFFEGFLLSASLIIAIGPQNLFVLKQGLKKQHLLLAAATCSISDSILIILGVYGVAKLITAFPIFLNIMLWGGVLFLFWYGIKCFRSAFHPEVMVTSLENELSSNKWATFISLLGFTLLNPHVYIDNVLVLGTVGAERASIEQIPFIIGASAASFVWFFSLSYGASILSHLFKNPRVWQILETIMGFIMIGIAVNLLIKHYQ